MLLNATYADGVDQNIAQGTSKFPAEGIPG